MKLKRKIQLMLKDLKDHNQESTILYDQTWEAFEAYKIYSKIVFHTYLVIGLNILSGLYIAISSYSKLYLLNIIGLLAIGISFNRFMQKKNLMKKLLLKNYKIYLSWQKK